MRRILSPNFLLISEMNCRWIYNFENFISAELLRKLNAIVGANAVGRRYSLKSSARLYDADVAWMAKDQGQCSVEGTVWFHPTERASFKNS